MTFEESAKLITDITFRGRIQVAVITFAKFVSAQPKDTPAYNTQRRWADNALQNSVSVAGALQPSVVMDVAVQTDGADIEDQALQAAVETVVKNSF